MKRKAKTPCLHCGSLRVRNHQGHRCPECRYYNDLICTICGGRFAAARKSTQSCSNRCKQHKWCQEHLNYYHHYQQSYKRIRVQNWNRSDRRRIERWGYPWLRQQHNRWWVRFPWTKGWVPQAWIIWIQANGPIPDPGLGRRASEYCVHHINGDKLDDHLENLDCLTNHKHQQFHHVGRKHS